jgi:hypothetical protein
MRSTLKSQPCVRENLLSLSALPFLGDKLRMQQDKHLRALIRACTPKKVVRSDISPIARLLASQHPHRNCLERRPPENIRMLHCEAPQCSFRESYRQRDPGLFYRIVEKMLDGTALRRYLQVCRYLQQSRTRLSTSTHYRPRKCMKKSKKEACFDNTNQDFHQHYARLEYWLLSGLQEHLVKSCPDWTSDADCYIVLLAIALLFYLHRRLRHLFQNKASRHQFRSSFLSVDPSRVLQFEHG